MIGNANRDPRTASGAGLFPGCVLEIAEPLEQLGALPDPARECEFARLARPLATPMAPLSPRMDLRSHRHASPKPYGASVTIHGNVMNSSLCAGCLTGSLSDFGSDGCATTGSCNTVARWPATSLVRRTIRPAGNSTAS